MTAAKMLKILNYVNTVHCLHRCMVHSVNGEVALSFTSQPPLSLHSFLLGLGFVIVDSVYIYRP